MIKLISFRLTFLSQRPASLECSINEHGIFKAWSLSDMTLVHVPLMKLSRSRCHINMNFPHDVFFRQPKHVIIASYSMY